MNTATITQYPDLHSVNDSSSTIDIPYGWDEDAEIEYVLQEEDAPETTSWKREDLLHRMMHGRLLNKQIRRARHVPGLVYAPAVLVGWVSLPAHSLVSMLEQYKHIEKRDEVVTK